VSAAAHARFDEPYRPDRAPFLWLLEREVVRFLKIWPFTIVGQIVSALLFVVVFGLGLSGKIGPVDGVPYDGFILPGLVVQAMFTVGFVNGTTSLFEARHDRYIHGVLSSPLRWWEVNLALVLGGAVRELLVGAGVLVVAGPIVGIGVARPTLAFAAIALLIVSGAQVGVLVGSYARTLDDVYTVESLVVLPLGFLAGIFYAVSSLPPTWRVLTYFDPLFYYVDAFRAGLLGHADLAPAASLGASAAFALFLTVWSLAVFRSAKRLKP
jgi:ABC-2 type transport system permease protein